MKKINLHEKFNLFDDHWSPKIIGELNGQAVKLAKVQGEFVWHDHKDEDELFYIVKGTLKIEFRDKTVTLHPGEMLIVPKGVEHKPIAEEEVWLMLFEPMATKHTGDVEHEITVKNLDRL
jgi:mannose-6-phosphate isomerase-like protein (cupin superfamily)